MSEEESLVEVPRIRWKNEVPSLSLYIYIYSVKKKFVVLVRSSRLYMSVALLCFGVAVAVYFGILIQVRKRRRRMNNRWTSLQIRWKMKTRLSLCVLSLTILWTRCSPSASGVVVKRLALFFCFVVFVAVFFWILIQVRRRRKKEIGRKQDEEGNGERKTGAPEVCTFFSQCLLFLWRRV